MTQRFPDSTGRLNDLGSLEQDEPVRLGILGGTFDPIHIGHLRIAEEAREQLGLAGVLFIPTGNPVFKKDQNVTDASTRLKQVERATADNPYFGVSALEVEREGDTFTIDTLQALRDHYPQNVSFYFIVGSDAAASLPKWRSIDDLARLTTFVLAGDRPGEKTLETIRQQLGSIPELQLEYLPIRALDVSSSEIRLLAQHGDSIRYLVPESIRVEVQEQYARDRQRDTNDAHETALSDTFFEVRRQDVQDRVSTKRFAHSEGVAQTAEELARIYDVDTRKARLAGILHDWDKCYNDEEIRLRVQELGLQDAIDPQVIADLPATLHGMTAAHALAQEYPEIPSDVIQAIRRHTIADEDMEPLDMVIYIADALEPNRNYGQIDELRALIGTISLEELFFKVFHYWVETLMEQNRTIYPDTIRVWNAYAKRLHPRKGFTGHDRKN